VVDVPLDLLVACEHPSPEIRGSPRHRWPLSRVIARDHGDRAGRVASRDDAVVSDLPRSCYQRATALVTDPAGRLLVFDHVGDPAPGTQVPAGGVEANEEPAAAVRRELAEESGLDTARLVRKLGEVWYVAAVGNVPPGLEEQVHHAYHLHLDEPPVEDTWEWDECGGGDVPLHRFAFRWVTLDQAAAILRPIQAIWTEPLRSSLAHL
jgi:8-oxo-dGTP pyrophosphatase MutT (NUDIX family)